MRKAKSIFCMMLVFMPLIFIGMGICSVHENNREPRAILSATTVEVINPSPVNIYERLIVNVSVIEVEDLFAWQVSLAYNVTVMNFTRAWYPSDHVFAGKASTSLPAEAYYDPTVPTWYVFYGNSLLAPEKGFSGSGVLCQIEFETYALGESYLYFMTPTVDTVLLNSTQQDIEFDTLDSSVTIVPEFPSLLPLCLFLFLTLIGVSLVKFLPKRKM